MRKIIGFITAVIIAVSSSSVLANNWETWYVGAWSGLNCRTAPSTDAEILTTYPHGTELQIIGADGAWWESWDGSIQGWVHSDYLTDKLYCTYSEVDYSCMTCLGEMRITEYTPAPEENGGYSVDRHGNPLAPQVGQICAVDGVTIPWDRTIYIEGVGYRRTVDSGVYGRVVDVLSWGDLDITGDRTVWLVE